MKVKEVMDEKSSLSSTSYSIKEEPIASPKTYIKALDQTKWEPPVMNMVSARKQLQLWTKDTDSSHRLWAPKTCSSSAQVLITRFSKFENSFRNSILIEITTESYREPATCIFRVGLIATTFMTLSSQYYCQCLNGIATHIKRKYHFTHKQFLKM